MNIEVCIWPAKEGGLFGVKIGGIISDFPPLYAKSTQLQHKFVSLPYMLVW